MKPLAFALAAVAALALPALADQPPAGVAGVVVDLDRHAPLAGAQVDVYRMPAGPTSAAISSLHTDRHGFFGDITLEPGRYLITATANGMRSSCEISQLYNGVVTRMRIELSARSERCVGRNVSNSLIVPGQGADVYIVHSQR